MVLFIIGLVLIVGIIGFLVYKIIRFNKEKPLGGKEIKVDKNLFITFISLAVSGGLSLIMTGYGFALWQKYVLTVGEHFSLIIGGFLFFASLISFASCFVISYFKEELDKKQHKIMKIVMFSSIPVIIAGLWLFTEAFAFHIEYPLVNAFSFYPFGFIRPKDASYFRVTFYGIVIVIGALISYAISDHYFFKKYGKRGLLDAGFLIAFPMGIVGGRLWYCLVLEPETYLANPLSIITGIVDGGMGIMGGALLGIISGIIYFRIFRRYVDFRWAFDAIIPTILIAQFVGRWGNFFNCEVHGLPVDMYKWYFFWIPNIIKMNMQHSTVVSSQLNGTSQMYLPLFLIEGLMNLAGYFIIRYATKPLNRFIPLMARGGMYPLWYGLVRVILEPLRTGWNAEGNGDAYTQSWIIAFVMVGGGLAIIAAAYIWAFIEKKVKKLDHIRTFDFE